MLVDKINLTQGPKMFQPTHNLISRSKQTPVQLMPTTKGYALYTQQEWGKDKQPAFEIRSKQGIFCLGTPVVGYSLQPLKVTKPSEHAQTAVVN
jgi:hypothetical protein